MSVPFFQGGAPSGYIKYTAFFLFEHSLYGNKNINIIRTLFALVDRAMSATIVS